MKPVVFAGPSIYGMSSSLLAGVDIRPPARRGDLWRASLEGAQVIGLIDGCFETTLPTWHKEILGALKRGAIVVGAASMGALRAAECQSFGMIGIGKIYQEYRHGMRTADSDVALEFGTAEIGYQPLGICLADIEYFASNFTISGQMTLTDARRIVDAARQLHYKERTVERLEIAFNKLLKSDDVGKFMRFLQSTECQKSADAKSLIKYVLTAPSLKQQCCDYSLNVSCFMAKMHSDTMYIR